METRVARETYTGKRTGQTIERVAMDTGDFCASSHHFESGRVSTSVSVHAHNNPVKIGRWKTLKQSNGTPFRYRDITVQVDDQTIEITIFE